MLNISYCNISYFSLSFFRRVHITQATLDYLGGEYEVEAGMGATRNQYLRDHCVTTYFIVPPARRRKVPNVLRCTALTSGDIFVLQTEWKQQFAECNNIILNLARNEELISKCKSLIIFPLISVCLQNV